MILKVTFILILVFPILVKAQLVQADTNTVCKGQSVRLFVNPKLFSPADFCLDLENEHNGLYYFSTCGQVTFDAAFAFVRIMKGNLVTVNAAAMNSNVSRLKSAYMKRLGFFKILVPKPLTTQQILLRVLYG